jgi:DNA-binding MarR family transcriptional regulator
MTRTLDTSREAYYSVLPELSDRQAAVLALLERSEPMTNAEIGQALGWAINRVTPRTLELRELGKVRDFGKRACTVTGRTAYQWGVVRTTLFG